MDIDGLYPWVINICKPRWMATKSDCRDIFSWRLEAQPFLWLWSFLLAPLWRLCARLPGLSQANENCGGFDPLNLGIDGESMGNLWGITVIYRESLWDLICFGL